MSKKSDAVYLPIWGILKLSAMLNQTILKLSIRGISYDPKLYITRKKILKLSVRSQNYKLSNIYPGSETVRHENDRQIAFYSPLYCIKDGSTDLGPVHRNIFARGH